MKLLPRKNLQRRNAIALPTRGVALMELLVVCALFGVFMFIASKLFIVTITAQSAANKQDNLIHEVDSAITLLRKDVWASNRITYDEGQLKLLGPSDGPIQWDLRAPNHLSRTTPRATTFFPNVPNPEVQLKGALVKLTFPNKSNPSETLTLASQILLTNGAE